MLDNAKGEDLLYGGGETEGTGAQDAINDAHVTFLPALRDAEADLRPGRRTRVTRLLNTISTEKERQDVVAVVTQANDNIGNAALIKRARTVINDILGGIAGPVRPSEASLAMASDVDFQGIADSIKVLFGNRGKKHFEVTENGLGYNNLLYISTVLGELVQSAEQDQEPSLPILAIEEPEAHLHPQSQLQLIKYLQENKQKAVQVLLTSHSPTLASSVPIDRLVVLHEGRTENQRGKMVAISLQDCGLEPAEMQDLRRYLDITKSTLFFAQGVILVEGISEALVLPALVKQMNGDIDLTKYRVSIVNVNSLAFDPFAKLFQEGGLDIPCALISDADPQVTDEEKKDLSRDALDQIVYPEQLGRISSTAQKLQGFQSGQLKVFLAAKTFEYDLALKSKRNVELMTKVYKEKLNHPTIGKNIELALPNCHTLREKARAFFLKGLWKSTGVRRGGSRNNLPMS